MATLTMFLAMAGSAGQGEQGSPLGFFLPIILIFAIMYFLIFRPQAKRQREHRNMQETLQKGDKIITAGGIYGTIEGIREKDDAVILKIADNVKIYISKSSIARKTNEPEAK